MHLQWQFKSLILTSRGMDKSQGLWHCIRLQKKPFLLTKHFRKSRSLFPMECVFQQNSIGKKVNTFDDRFLKFSRWNYCDEIFMFVSIRFILIN